MITLNGYSTQLGSHQKRPTDRYGSTSAWMKYVPYCEGSIRHPARDLDTIPPGNIRWGTSSVPRWTPDIFSSAKIKGIKEIPGFRAEDGTRGRNGGFYRLWILGKDPNHTLWDPYIIYRPWGVKVNRSWITSRLSPMDPGIDRTSIEEHPGVPIAGFFKGFDQFPRFPGYGNLSPL